MPEVPAEYAWLVPVLSSVGLIIAAALGYRKSPKEEPAKDAVIIRGAAVIDSSIAERIAKAAEASASASKGSCEALHRIAKIMDEQHVDQKLADADELRERRRSDHRGS